MPLLGTAPKHSFTPLHIQVTFFPRFHDFVENMGTTYKALDVKRDLQRRIPLGLQAAVAKFNKWNNKRWTRPRHLLGLLCIEERRQLSAFLLVAKFGDAEQMNRAFARVGAAAGERGTPSQLAQRGIAAMGNRAKSDAVGAVLRQWVLKALQRGTMEAFMRKHEMLDGNGKLAAALQWELILLAVTPPRDTEEEPIFSTEKTPLLYEKFIGLLFVGFAHNLLVESYVSRVSTISKVHQGVEPMTLAATFMYKTSLEGEKSARRSKELRVRRTQRRHGAQLRLDKDLKKDGINKLQLRTLEVQAVARAEAMQARRSEFFTRKDGAALGRQVQLKRAAVKGRTRKVAGRQLSALVRTCKVGPSGRARQAPLTAEECTFYLPDDMNVPENRRSNPFKKAGLWAKGDAKVRAQRQGKKEARKRRSRQRKYTERELSRLAAGPALPKKSRQPRGAKAANRNAPRPAARWAPRRRVPALSDDDGERSDQLEPGAEGNSATTWNPAAAAQRPASSSKQVTAPPRSPRAPRLAATAARSQFAGADADASDADGDQPVSEGESEASEAEVAPPPKRRKRGVRAAKRVAAHMQPEAAPATRRRAAQPASKAGRLRVIMSDNESDDVEDEPVREALPLPQAS